MQSLGLSSQLADLSVCVRPVRLALEDGRAAVAGEPVWFTRRELEVLPYLMLNGGRPVPRDEIQDAVWAPRIAGFKDRSVEVHVVRLRRKLAAACANFTYIHTHHRIGYRDWHITDPAGRDLDEARRIRSSISDHVLDLLKELLP